MQHAAAPTKKPHGGGFGTSAFQRRKGATSNCTPLNGVSPCGCESRAAEPLLHLCEVAAVHLGDSSAPATIAAGRLSQAGRVSGGACCGCLRAFQRLSCGLPSRSNLIVFPCPIFSANEKQWGFEPVIFPNNDPAPPLNFFSVRLALLGCTAGLHVALLRLCTGPCLARAHDKLCVSVIANQNSRFTYRQGVRFDRAPTPCHTPIKIFSTRGCVQI